MKKRCEICYRFLKAEAYVILGNAGKMCVCRECVNLFNLVAIRYKKEKEKWVQDSQK